MAKEFSEIGNIEPGSSPSVEQLDQIYEIIANAPESEKTDLISELADQYPDSGGDILAAVIEANPEEAQSIAVATAEVLPEATATVVSAVAEAAPEAATQIASDIAQTNPEAAQAAAQAKAFPVNECPCNNAFFLSSDKNALYIFSVATVKPKGSVPPVKPFERHTISG